VRCPHCGQEGHEEYEYKGCPILACPKAPEDKILSYAVTPIIGVDSNGFKMWECLECGERGVGKADAFFTHIEQHRIESDWGEAGNYFGE